MKVTVPGVALVFKVSAPEVAVIVPDAKFISVVLVALPEDSIATSPLVEVTEVLANHKA